MGHTGVAWLNLCNSGEFPRIPSFSYGECQLSTEKKVYPIGEWLEAECIPTPGFAVRRGFHCCFEMNAPTFKKEAC